MNGREANVHKTRLCMHALVCFLLNDLGRHLANFINISSDEQTSFPHVLIPTPTTIRLPGTSSSSEGVETGSVRVTPPDR